MYFEFTPRYLARNEDILDACLTVQSTEDLAFLKHAQAIAPTRAQRVSDAIALQQLIVDELDLIISPVMHNNFVSFISSSRLISI